MDLQKFKNKIDDNESANDILDEKIANLFEDMGTLKKVQKIAMEIMADDPLLEKEKNIKIVKKILIQFINLIKYLFRSLSKERLLFICNLYQVLLLYQHHLNLLNLKIHFLFLIYFLYCQ